MADINTITLLNQIKAMSAQASGEGSIQAPGGVPFSAIFQKALGQVDHLNKNADALRTSFESGDPKVGIAEVMVATQKSTLAFEATLRVRNKLLQAYQDIMNMPL